MLLAQIPGGGVPTTFNTTFVPQFIVLRGTAGADILPDITISVNVQGDGVIMNLDPTGVAAMSNINQFLSAASRATVGLVFQMAEGLVTGKNTFWTINNADAAAVDVFGWSKQKLATFWLTYLTQLNLANSGTDYTKFAYLAVPGATAADNFSVLYNDGTMNANMTLRELAADNAYYQSSDQFALNNINPARVKLLTYIPSATNRNAYLMKYQPVQGAVDAAAVARG